MIATRLSSALLGVLTLGPSAGCIFIQPTPPGAICGDGVREGAEQCDDGNNFNGDGCENSCTFTPGPATGDVQFQYVILENDGTGNVEANDCATAGVGFVRFAVGDDLDGNDILDDIEEFEFAVAACNQTGDVNGDGVVDLDEIGEFNGLGFTADSYSHFSIEFLDGAQAALGWRVLEDPLSGTLSAEATRFSFPGGITLAPNVINVIPFAGDELQLGEELQAFFGF